MAVGIYIGGAQAEVAVAVGGNAVMLHDREGFELDLPTPPLNDPPEAWQTCSRGRGCAPNARWRGRSRMRCWPCHRTCSRKPSSGSSGGAGRRSRCACDVVGPDERDPAARCRPACAAACWPRISRRRRTATLRAESRLHAEDDLYRARRDAPRGRCAARPVGARNRAQERHRHRGRLRGLARLLDLSRHRRSGMVRTAEGGERGRGGHARPRLRPDRDLAPRLPDHHHRGAGRSRRQAARPAPATCCSAERQAGQWRGELVPCASGRRRRRRVAAPTPGTNSCCGWRAATCRKPRSAAIWCRITCSSCISRAPGGSPSTNPTRWPRCAAPSRWSPRRSMSRSGCISNIAAAGASPKRRWRPSPRRWRPSPIPVSCSIAASPATGSTSKWRWRRA